MDLPDLLMHVLRTRPQWGLIPLRIALGVILILQCRDVLLLQSREAQVLFRRIDGWPARVARWLAVLTGICGVLFVLGFMTRVLGLVVAIIIVSAIIVEGAKVHGVFEARMKTVLLAVAMLFFLSGGGRHSMDWYLAKHIEKNNPNSAVHAYITAETDQNLKWWW